MCNVLTYRKRFQNDLVWFQFSMYLNSVLYYSPVSESFVFDVYEVCKKFVRILAI